MKILILSHSALTTGGAEKCLIEYVDVLIAAGHDCRVIVPQEGDLKKVLTAKGIKCSVVGYGWAIRPHKKVKTHEVLASTGNSLVKLFHETEKFKPDVIITNTAVIPWGLYVGKALHIPTVLLVHEILNDKDPSLDVLPNYEEYVEILNRNTDYVVYNSDFVKGEYQQHLNRPVVSKEILYPLPPLDKENIKAIYKKNVYKETVSIAILGALAPRKNQMEALEAASVLKKNGVTNFRIDLYGDVAANLPYVRKLKDFISKHGLSELVHIKGYADNVYEKMNEYNVVLSTSTYEPFGRTIIEAQLFGRTVITNSTGGGIELVEDGQTGLIYESGKPKHLAEKIEWVINNNDKAVSLGLNSKTRQLKKYITDSRYDALLESVNYFADKDRLKREDYLFDPVRSLLEYNHQLNDRYKHVVKLVNNRVTRRVKHVSTEVTRRTKRIIKEMLS